MMLVLWSDRVEYFTSQSTIILITKGWIFVFGSEYSAPKIQPDLDIFWTDFDEGEAH